VPKLFLPEHEWDTAACCKVSHPIDMGDLVLIVNAHHKNFLLNGNMGKHLKHAEDTSMPQYNAFCNVCTINYMLAGISNYAERVVVQAVRDGGVLPLEILQKHAWYQLLSCLKIVSPAHPDPLMVEIRSSDGLVVGSCTSHDIFDSNERNQGKQGATLC
jgi:hypothetical protein